MPLSLFIEELFLGYFYTLTKREVLRGDSLSTFWDMDTFYIYTLLEWEWAQMKDEPHPDDGGGTEANPVVTGERHIPQDPEIAGLFPEFDDPEE